MPRDPRYDVLFEPVRIGPVTARNRFYQVPHCNGMGHAMPRAHAAMRGVKAEGGWAVVCTEECEIHPTSDITGYIEGRLWDDADIPALALMTEAVHAHGALAGIELVHNGPACPNRYSRETPIAPSPQPGTFYDPVQARGMDKSDIRDFRRWHRAAALRARRAGFDIVYVYAGHDLALPMHFLQRRRNTRTDEYGGSLENRARLFRELIEETKDAVGDTCGVAVRFAVDELMGPLGIESAGEGREVVEMLAELPDLWDVNVSPWANDSVSSRFAKEGFQEPFISFVKTVTSKPVVGVGRYTSPDTMVAAIRGGVLDMIGAARPSIADPFLPNKIRAGRLDDICECIGCNLCVSGDWTMSPIRCTQNPTMGEEWRRGWHPERIARKASDDAVLVVGAGPAGLECALALGRRGYGVHLAEATEEIGGRVAREARLPGLSEWIRVRDYRRQQLADLAAVEIYPASRLTAGDILDLGFAHVVLATGARWRRDGIGRALGEPVPGLADAKVFTPDDLMDGDLMDGGGDGGLPAGPMLIFDDDHYYLGGVLAERLRALGREVVLATPADSASAWTANTLDHPRIQKRLLEIGVTIMAGRVLAAARPGAAELACIYTDRRIEVPCAAIVTVTSRLPEDSLYRTLAADPDRLAGAGIQTLRAIGDAFAPSTIAAAVYAGHRFAREFQAPPPLDVPFKRELPTTVAG
jgi:dimethylamine/trimethylamine dehydrogenase